MRRSCHATDSDVSAIGVFFGGRKICLSRALGAKEIRRSCGAQSAKFIANVEEFAVSRRSSGNSMTMSGSTPPGPIAARVVAKSA